MEQFKSYQEYFNSLPKEHQNIIKDFDKIRQRFKRHGDAVLRNKGRKKKSESEKKANKKLYYQMRHEKLKQEKIANGTYRPKGRPRKKKEEETQTE